VEVTVPSSPLVGDRAERPVSARILSNLARPFFGTHSESYRVWFPYRINYFGGLGTTLLGQRTSDVRFVQLGVIAGK
jgi:hypothetical protein